MMTTTIRLTTFNAVIMSIISIIILLTTILFNNVVVYAYVPSIHSHDQTVITTLPKPTVQQHHQPILTALTIEEVTSSLESETNVIPSTVLKSSISSQHHAHRYTKWGVDNTHPEEYWFDKRIHTLGNHGFSGALHAALAPVSTKIIDVAAYRGMDVRLKLAQELSDRVGLQKARVVDLCCGVGISTRALQQAFPDATTIVGIDTSKEMVAMAKFLTGHLQMFLPMYEALFRSYKRMKRKGSAIMKHATKKRMKDVVGIQFLQRNAECTTLPDESFDLVTVMYGFHEAPLHGRDKILKEARRLLSPGGILAVIDISTEYIPSPTMLEGEPYVQEYQQNIHNQLQHIHGFQQFQFRNIVDHHLSMWTLTRSTPNVA